jgi:hypothetical protein
MKECKFEKIMKDDFVESAVGHNGLTQIQALELWEKHGEYYLDKVYQAMTIELDYILNGDR